MATTSCIPSFLELTSSSSLRRLWLNGKIKIDIKSLKFVDSSCNGCHHGKNINYNRHNHSSSLRVAELLLYTRLWERISAGRPSPIGLPDPKVAALGLQDDDVVGCGGAGGCVRGGGDNDGNKQVAEGTSGCTKGGPFRIDLWRIIMSQLSWDGLSDFILPFW